MESKQSGKGNSKWKPGAKIKIGGRDYIVKERETTAPKGLALAWIIATADGSRTYRWRPFRGLELISGQELVRPRRRRTAGNHAQPVAANGKPDSALLGVIIDDIRENPRDGTQEFLTKVLAFFGVNLAGDGKTPAKRRQAPAGDGHDVPAPETVG